MRIAEILHAYADEAIDRLAVDKVDEIAHLRLPRQVLIQEVTAALSSLSYVAKVLAPTRPPAYAFLKLLMDAPDRRAPVEGFRDRVIAATDELTREAAEGKDFSQRKDFTLYLRILFAAWEDDGKVDRSEALLLAALRKELGIWTREHLVLEHHPLVRPIWDSERSYEDARNHLLATGLVLMCEASYVLPEEVCVQIRRSWDIDLEDAAYGRLLDRLTGGQLRAALEASALPLSGSKEERVERVIRALVPPAEILDTLHINAVKDLCRALGLQVSAAKADLIAGVIDHFDSGGDLGAATDAIVEPPPAPEPEPRSLDAVGLGRLLEQLRGDLLYDILAALRLRRSGSKAEKIQNLIDSPWSERTLLGALRRTDLIDLCRNLGVPVSGVKDEIMDRLVAWAAKSEAEVERLAPDPETEPPSPLPTIADPVPVVVPAQPPAGLSDIQSRLPTLPHDEQVVLALLAEARSLNEGEIERAARHHGLGWFLTKAHMADLLAHLRQAGSNPIQVRSSAHANVYEWSAPAPATPAGIDQPAARDLIDALRQGVVPDRYLELLAVGQDAARRHLVGLLDHVQHGRSALKFVRGPYGAGKSFLCAWLRERAFAADFAVATVRIGPDQPLTDLPVFFSSLADGLRTPEKREASALADILESWLLAIHKKAARREGIDAFSRDDQARLAPLVERQIEEELAGLSGIEPGFAPALRAFYRARLAGDHDLASTALGWLRGTRTLAADALRRIGVRGQLAPEEVFPRLRAVLAVLAGGRLNGLLLVIDELELVRRFPHARQREQAYEILRLLIDECGENDLPGCLVLCTGTDQLFDDERYGLPSYQALAHRIEPPRAGDGTVNVRQPILLLEPLDRGRLLEAAINVRRIHGVAYDWRASERVPDEVLARLVEQMTQFGDDHVERLPRPCLREVVHLLDLCEERPEVPAAAYLEAPAAAGTASGISPGSSIGP